MDSNSVKALAENAEVISGLINIVAAIIYALATSFAAGVAIYGIRSWRREFKGKRQIELAEDVLALFYQARDAITSIRNPLAMGDELSAPPNENESVEEKEARDKVYFIFKRYRDREELFSKLSSIRYRFMAQNGQDKVGAFDEIIGIMNEILIAARMSAYAWAKLLKSHSTKQVEAYHEEIRKCKAKIYWAGEEDEIAKRVEKAVSDMEQTCNNIIVKGQRKQ